MSDLTRAAHPACCGWSLDQFAEREGLDEAALAAFLGCTDEQVAHLALCLFPRPKRWREDVTELAERYGCDPARLSQALVVDRGQ